MKVFLINLDKDTERLSSASAQLRTLHVGYERVRAVNACEMSDVEKKRVISPFRWWCAMGRPVRGGEIGCLLSHQSIYRRMVAERIAFACVLEDDVILDDRFPIVLNRLEREVAVDQPRLVLLSNHISDTGMGSHHAGFLSSQDVSFSLVRACRGSYSEGYVLNYAGACSLLRQNSPMIVPADGWSRWVRTRAIELYYVAPIVCSQNKDGFESLTVDFSKDFSVARLSRWRWVLHKIKRIVGKSIDWALIMLVRK